MDRRHGGGGCMAPRAQRAARRTYARVRGSKGVQKGTQGERNSGIQEVLVEKGRPMVLKELESTRTSSYPTAQRPA
jgi:hypothetical protein